jgi:hypothetical protein
MLRARTAIADAGFLTPPLLRGFNVRGDRPSGHRHDGRLPSGRRGGRRHGDRRRDGHDDPSGGRRECQIRTPRLVRYKSAAHRSPVRMARKDRHRRHMASRKPDSKDNRGHTAPPRIQSAALTEGAK